jgi:hypothetical protein
MTIFMASQLGLLCSVNNFATKLFLALFPIAQLAALQIAVWYKAYNLATLAAVNRQHAAAASVKEKMVTVRKKGFDLSGVWPPPAGDCFCPYDNHRRRPRPQSIVLLLLLPVDVCGPTVLPDCDF